MITLRDYAKNKKISYEAVRKQVNRYQKELSGHIIRDGRQQFLDEDAVAFLDSKRMKNPVVLVQRDKDDLIEDLKRENDNLRIKIAEQGDKIAMLSEWKADKALEIARAEQNQFLLEDKSKQLEEAQERERKLQEEHNKEVADLQKELERPLTWKERWTGKRVSR